MRTTIITFSIVAAITLIVFGGLLNAISSGLGIDTLAPYNEPIRVVWTLIGDVPGFAFALAGMGYAFYDAARRGVTRWFMGLLVWPVVPLVAASLMYAGALSYAIYWFVPLAFLPLASLLYGIIALPATAAILPPPAAIGGPLATRSPARFLAFVGLLVLVALGGGAFLLAPNVQPASSAPGGPPALQVTQTTATADCANGIYPTVTLTNTGAQALHWTAKSQDPNVATAPAAGSLAPFATAQVTLTGKSIAADVIVQFTSDAGSGVAKFSCQTGASK
jgi:hypothetical protein